MTIQPKPTRPTRRHSNSFSDQEVIAGERLMQRAAMLPQLREVMRAPGIEGLWKKLYEMKKRIDERESEAAE